MNPTAVSGVVLILVAALLAVLTPTPAAQTTAREPRIIRVSSRLRDNANCRRSSPMYGKGPMRSCF